MRRLVIIATKGSPDLAEQIISEIPDEEVRAFQNVTFANTLLQANDYPMPAIIWRRSGHDTVRSF
jgi:hypothetical protein